MFKRNSSILLSVIWLVAAFCWLAMLITDIVNGNAETKLVFLHIMCFILTMICAVLNFIKYLRNKKK